jgi:hypothetical protein
MDVVEEGWERSKHSLSTQHWPGIDLFFSDQPDLAGSGKSGWPVALPLLRCTHHSSSCQHPSADAITASTTTHTITSTFLNTASSLLFDIHACSNILT